MAEYGTEGRKIIDAFLKKMEELGTRAPGQSTNTLKHINRALGSAIFSPDSIGYLDIIEDGLAAGKDPKKILDQIRSTSDKLVKSYSFAPGIFEPHHVVALNALRDDYIKLPEAERAKFMQKLGDAGWQLGDSPQQLMYTLQSTLGHRNVSPADELKKKGDIEGKLAFEGIQKNPEGGFTASHGDWDSGKVRTNWAAMTSKGATTADELFSNWSGIADTLQRQAITGNILESGMRDAVLKEHGYDLGEMTPEIASAITEGRKKMPILQTAAQGYQPMSTTQVADEFKTVTGQDIDTFTASPDAPLNANQRRLLRSPAGQNVAKLLGYSALLPAAAMLPIQAQASEQADERARQDPSLLNQARAFTERVSLEADKVDAVMPNPIAGGVSNAASVASMVLETPEAIQRNQANLKAKREGTYQPVQPPQPSDRFGYRVNDFLKDPIGSTNQGLRNAWTLLKGMVPDKEDQQPSALNMMSGTSSQ